jgi:hypothetical protein
MMNWLVVAVALISCKKTQSDPQPVPPPPDPVVTKGISGSFINKYQRYYKGDVFSGTKSLSWSDTCWRNDRIHNQIILWSDKNISGLSYQVSNLTNGGNTIPASNVRLRFESYIQGDQSALGCGLQTARTTLWVPDALATSPVTSLTTADPVKIWVTVDIPSGITPGTYSGTIKVLAGDSVLTFGLNYLVVNKDLPAVSNWKFHLDLWQFPYQLTKLINSQSVEHVEPFSTQYFALMSPFYKMLADAGQTAITAYIKDGSFQPGQTMIQWIRNADNSWKYDYTNFDKYVDSLSSWGINKQINCFSLAGWQSNTIGYFDVATNSTLSLDAPIGSAVFNTAWQNFLTDFKSHLDAKGWFGKTVLCMDESPDQIMTAVISTIKNNNANWKIGLAGSHASGPNESQLYDYSTIYGTGRVNNPSINPISTFYTSCTQTIPNDYITRENSPAEMPWMAWYAASKGLGGYLRWAFDYWTLTDPTSIQDGANTSGDFSFIYRTNNTISSQPLSSVRFELLREGIQDFEKMQILSNNNPGQFAQLQSLLSQFSSSNGSDAVVLVSQGENILKLVAAKN